MNRPTRAALLRIVVMIAGAGGIMGQILILREFMTAAHGNELTMGMVLANWLIVEAAGAWVGGKRADSLGRPSAAYVVLLSCYALALPLILSIVGAAPRWLFGILPGEGVGVLPLLVSSLVLIGPASAVHGAMFPIACRIMSDSQTDRSHTSVGITYVYENLGTLLGGLLLTLILVGRFPPVKLATGIAVVHLLTALVLAIQVPPKRLPTWLKIIAAAGAVLLIVASPAIAERLHQASLRWYWAGQQVILREDSPFGSIAVIKREDEHTFFYDGQPVLTTPNPDTASTADFAHIAGAMHHRPRRVLVIGGGLGGMLDELLKHPVEQLTYVEMDPTLPQLIEQFSAPVTERELKDPRVTLKHTDARLFVRKTQQAYDLLVLGFIRPSTLQTNRLFTKEFFTAARQSLLPDGVLVFSLPGSAAYMSDAMVGLNSSIFRTVGAAFPHITLIPGERNIFMASGQPLPTEPSVLAQRLQQREVQQPEFLTADYLRYRFDAERRQWAMKSIEGTKTHINRDFHPAGLLYALTHWGEMFSPKMGSLVDRLRQQPSAWYFISPAVLLAVLLPLVRKAEQGRQTAVVYAVASTGMVAMAIDLLVLLIFQCLYGYVYQMAGLLVASFMGGIFLGGRWGLHQSRSDQNGALFFRLDVTVTALLPGLYGIAVLLQQLAGRLPDPLMLTMLALFSCACGFAAGGQFPLAAAIFSAGRPEGGGGATAGVLYSADLLGGWFAGLAVALVLFPVLGLLHTAGFLFAHKLASLLLLSSVRGGVAG